MERNISVDNTTKNEARFLAPSAATLGVSSAATAATGAATAAFFTSGLCRAD